MDCVNMTTLCNKSLPLSGPTNVTAAPVTDSVSSDHTNALLYIICVLMFYAFSIVILMVKYVRREQEEADQRNFFNEFVKRDAFHTPRYQNKLLMQKLFSDHCMQLPREHQNNEIRKLFDDSETAKQGLYLEMA